MRILLASLIIGIASAVWAGTDDNPPPPPPPPPACCDEGFGKRGTYDPPKCGEKGDDPPEVGQKGEVAILSGPPGIGALISGNGMAVEFSTGSETLLWGVGGGDSDVCVKTEGKCPEYRTYGVSSKYRWEGSGTFYTTQTDVFRFVPPAPGTYTVTFIADEGEEECNAGNESVSTSTQIVVYEIRGIYPDPTGDTIVDRGESQTFSVELENCTQISTYPRWSSTATTATGTGLSWGGKHAVSYTLTADVQASVTLPLNTVLVGKTLSKDVITTKGRTFNCTVSNAPKRYPVPSNYIGGRSGTELVTDACTSHSFGIMWDKPYPFGANQGTSMSVNVAVASISSGPNAGWFYVDNMDGVRFEVDTNTNVSFTSTTTKWYTNHSTEATALHTFIQGHEERHVMENVNSAEQDMPTQACNIPDDMYDQCEGVVSQVSAQAVKDSCATTLQFGVNYIRYFRWIYYEQMNQNDCPTCCDYFAGFINPGRMNCNPGIRPGTSTPCATPTPCP